MCLPKPHLNFFSQFLSHVKHLFGFTSGAIGTRYTKTVNESAGQTRGMAVFFISLLFSYAVTFTGFIVSGDNWAQYHQTVRMLDHGRFSFSSADVRQIARENDWGVDSRFLLNKDGKTYSQF